MLFKPFKIFCWRTGLICVEVTVVIAVLLALVTGLVVWRLTAGPMDVGFAKGYIQEALRNPERGTYAEMDKIMLHWPDLNGPLLLGFQGVRILDAQDEVIIAIDEAALSISKAPLFLGHIAPVALILKRPVLRVVRAEDGHVDIGFSASGDAESEQLAVSEAQEQTELTERILEYIARPGVEPDQDSPLATLRGFKVENAQLVFDDRLLGATWTIPRLDISFRSVVDGLTADVQAVLPVYQGENATIEGSLFFAWDSHNIGLSTALKNFNPAMLADKFPELSDLKDQSLLLDVQVSAQLGADLMPLEATIDLSAEEGHILVPELSPEPLPLKDLALHATYDGGASKLTVSEFKVTAKGVPVRAEATFFYNDGQVRVPVKVSIDEMKQAEIAPLWPEIIKGDNSETWVVGRLSDGTFYDVFAVMDLVLSESIDGWDADVKNIEAGFAFDGMSIDYRSPMTPVTQASGYGFFDFSDELLRVDIDQAKVGDLVITDGEVELYHIIEAGKGTADINIKLSGPFKSALVFASKEPISLEHDFDLDKIAGVVDAAVNVQFPTVKDLKVKDVKVSLSGTLSEAVLPDVVQGLDLTGGPFDLAITETKFSLKGSGKIGGRPVKLGYDEFLSSKGKSYSSRVKATIVADRKLREKFGVNLDEFLDGSFPVSVTYTEFSSGRSEADVAVDLTSGRFFVQPFDYEKPSGVKGSANLKVVLKNGIAKEVINLVAVAPGFVLEKSRLVFRQNAGETELDQGKVSRFVIGESVGSLEFDVEKSGRVKLAIEASLLDVRPFLNDDDDKKKIYDNPPMSVSVKADRMITDDGEFVQYGKVYADIDAQGRFNQFEFDADAGGGAIYLRFKPDETGKRTFRLEADDAGAALKAFGVYDKIVGGKLLAYAEPVRGVYDRNLLGSAEIVDFKVVGAPGLARLLSALSLPGLMSSLNDEGVVFTKLEADFDWFYRQGGGLLVLKNGRTSGNSLGLTFDGTFNQAESVVDVSGTLVPLSGVNKLISSIPILGKILTGGSSGGVFAATYKVKGDAKDPDISVNPLSVLAPGILRRILFE